MDFVLLHLQLVYNMFIQKTLAVMRMQRLTIPYFFVNMQPFSNLLHILRKKSSSKLQGVLLKHKQEFNINSPEFSGRFFYFFFTFIYMHI